MVRYWIGVVSKTHVERGIKGSFAQVCHGKKGPLQNLSRGDWLIYYSPKISFEGKEKCQCFTAIGQVSSDTIYQVEMTPSFKPYRLDLSYESATEVPLIELKQDLSFTRSKHYGMLFRRGLFEITKGDFDVISAAMGL